jgi:hypothetical protein
MGGGRTRSRLGPWPRLPAGRGHVRRSIDDRERTVFVAVASDCARGTIRRLWNGWARVSWFEVTSEKFMIGEAPRPPPSVRARWLRCAPRRLAVPQFNRPAERAVPSSSAGTGRSHRAHLGLRPSVLGRRGRPARTRPAASVLHRGGSRLDRRAGGGCRSGSAADSRHGGRRCYPGGERGTERPRENPPSGAWPAWTTTARR